MAQNLKINILARDKTKQALTSVRGGLAKVKSAVFSLQTAFVGLGAGLVIKNLVGTGRELENLRVRLKFLLKDTNEGAKAFDNMVKFASKVPFSLEEIQSGSGILATVTDNATDLQKMLEITGNVAATTGLDFRTAAEQIQRSFSAGIGAADLFREKGVRNMLGFKAGATVSIEETVAAFEKVFGRGGRFGNSTDELAKTFEGTLSMIGDKIFNFKKVLLEAGFFEELKKQFGDLDKFLADNGKRLDEIATTVGKNLAQAVSGAVSIGQDLIPTLQKIGSVLKSIKDGFMALPEFVREVGLVGAFIFGKKGAAGLAGISFLIDKVNDFVKETKAQIGIIDVNNIEEAKARLDVINGQLKSGVVLQKEEIEVGLGKKVLIEDVVKLNDLTIEQLKKEKAELETILILNGKGSENQFELNRHLKETTKEIEKQKIAKRFVTNAFEADLDLVKRLEKAEKDRSDKLIGSSRNIFDEQQKIADLFKGDKGGFEGFRKGLESEFDVTIFERFQKAGQSSLQSLKTSISDFVMTGKLSFKTLKEAIIKSLVEALVGHAVTSALKKATEIFKLQAIREGLISVFKAALKAFASIPFPFNIAAAGATVGAGMKLVDKIKGFESGGAVRKGQPTIVGEKGAEMFIPNTSGQITQTARGLGSGAVNVNFNINTVDASGFEDLLVRSRGTITQLINNAVNEKGRSSII
nr:phage tail tape measure protein, lambda family (tape_meas_lam_C) [uncultured Mediterranean phage uvMED]